ncbi:MAG TPA: hypothetical protein VIJ48_02150, partial [Acidimicrobiia bacterium]
MGDIAVTGSPQPGAGAHHAGRSSLLARIAPGRGLLGIAAVSLSVAALLVVTIIGSVATDQADARAQRSVELNAAYQRTATGVAAEESLERKYRLEPGPIPLAAHTAARQQVVQGLTDVRRLGNAHDRLLATKLLAEHSDYIAAATFLF